MGTPKVLRTDIEKLRYLLSEWLTACQYQEVSAESFLSCLSDSTVLNRILLKIPEVNHDISSFTDKVEKDSESNGNYNVLKEVCVKQLGIKEEDFFDQSILTVTNNAEANTNDDYIKLMQTIVAIAIVSLKSKELASKMNSELKEYLAGNLTSNDLEIDDVPQWNNLKKSMEGRSLQTVQGSLLSESKEKSRRDVSKESQGKDEIRRTNRFNSLQKMFNEHFVVEKFVDYYRYFQEVFYSEKGTIAAVSLFVLSTAVFLVTFEFIGDEDIPCWWDIETLYSEGDTYGYFCIFEPNEFNNLTQPTEFYAELSRDGVNPFAEMELLDRRWTRGYAVVLSAAILAIQQQERVVNFYRT